eukprot:CAMPEP_0117748650 /NCGR_PEP_ID=MMETSP0947-20121206/9268_1 /TAXON_ID=44440 /ORGANISM="Chattonella subsalsa, Strain CCMP2191" /LENGTH=584 /DNA_ID=CAMNT_0005566405 /DNA_START=94 /DNA_END=1844 /DNA_ORIENTATION=+
MKKWKELLTESEFARRAFLEILKQPNRLYGASKGPFLVNHSTFTALENLIGLIVDVCGKTADYFMAFSILLHSGNFFEVLKRRKKNQTKVVLDPQFLSIQIAKHRVYTATPIVWHYVIYRRLEHDTIQTMSIESPSSLVTSYSKYFQPQQIYSQMKVVIKEMKMLDLPLAVVKEFVNSAFDAAAFPREKHEALLYFIDLNWGEKELPDFNHLSLPSRRSGLFTRATFGNNKEWQLQQLFTKDDTGLASAALAAHYEKGTVSVGFSDGSVGISNKFGEVGNIRKIHEGPVVTVTCTSKYVVSASADSSLAISHIDSFKISHGVKSPALGILRHLRRPSVFKKQIYEGHKGPILCLTMIAKTDSDFVVATGGEDATVQLWKPSMASAQGKLYGHMGAVKCLEICRDKELLYSGSQDNSVSIWDLNSGQVEPESAFSGHHAAVQVVKQLGRQSCISGSSDTTLRIWDRRMHRCVSVLEGHNGPITCLQLAPNDSMAIASGSCDSNIFVWDIRKTDAGPTQKFRGHKNRVNSIVWSGSSIWSAGHDTLVNEWDVEYGSLTAVHPYHSEPVVCLKSTSVLDTPVSLLTA